MALQMSFMRLLRSVELESYLSLCHVSSEVKERNDKAAAKASASN